MSVIWSRGVSAIHWFLIQGCLLSRVLLYLNFQEERDTNQQVTKVSYTSASTIINYRYS